MCVLSSFSCRFKSMFTTNGIWRLWGYLLLCAVAQEKYKNWRLTICRNGSGKDASYQDIVEAALFCHGNLLVLSANGIGWAKLWQKRLGSTDLVLNLQKMAAGTAGFRHHALNDFVN